MTTMKTIQILVSLAIGAVLAGCATPKQPHCANHCSPVLPPEDAPAPAARASTPTQFDISGQWSWVCCDQRYSGKLELSQAADGSVSGRMFEANGDEAGQIAGSIKAGNVQLTRSWREGFEQTYTLTLSADGKALTGTLEGTRDESVGADFEARKL